jgi:hypothetical protein
LHSNQTSHGGVVAQQSQCRRIGFFGLKEVDTILVPLAVEQLPAYVASGPAIVPHYESSDTIPTIEFWESCMSQTKIKPS